LNKIKPEKEYHHRKPGDPEPGTTASRFVSFWVMPKKKTMPIKEKSIWVLTRTPIV
jgi:hypothetical protein